MAWNFACAQDIGDRREQQDRVAVIHSDDNRSHILVVADGMGGQGDGSAAAQTVIDITSRRFSLGAIEPKVFLQEVFHEAHDAILTLSERGNSTPGSTGVILYLTDKEAHWTHVGDSRLYQFRDNVIVNKTSDHSVAQLFQEHSDGANYDTEIEVSQDQLYMCLGGSNEVNPESHGSVVKPGDFFLLCSDGFWNQIDVEDTFRDAHQAPMGQEKAETLVGLARKKGNGSGDNISLAWASWEGRASHKMRGVPNRLIGLFRKSSV